VDIDLIHGLITRHAELTESPRAKWILDNWETMLPKFIKVFPHEFKRVLGIKRSPVTPEPVHAAPSPSAQEVRRG
jgi:glutamate synthase domain-containing protein 3